jgi:hypothetical protein
MRFAVLALLCLLGLLEPASAETGRLQLPEFATLAAKADESVIITLDSALLGMAGRFLDAGKPEEANAKKVVAGLQGIYVRSFQFSEAFAVPKADVEGIRKQLAAPGWQRLVEVRSRKENTDVEIYVLIEANKARGLAILANEPREFTVVNIVGSIDLEQLHQLEGQLGVPKLELEKAPKRPAAASK